MIAYEFSSKLTNGHLAIPEEFAPEIPSGSHIRVILLIEEASTITKEADYVNTGSLDALEQLVAKIKSMPADPANIIAASGLLAEHLTNPITEPDPDFDEQAWNREWARIEAEMEAASLAHEQEELKNLFP